MEPYSTGETTGLVPWRKEATIVDLKTGSCKPVSCWAQRSSEIRAGNGNGGHSAGFKCPGDDDACAFQPSGVSKSVTETDTGAAGKVQIHRRRWSKLQSARATTEHKGCLAWRTPDRQSILGKSLVDSSAGRAPQEAQRQAGVIGFQP